MKAVSLFAGIGGFDLGFERAGIETVAQVEYDKHATAALAQHWPDTERQTDIHGVTTLPEHDILVGGFPCQDYSVAGGRGGLAGDRGALWWEFHRLIASHRPEWVIGENVPGLLSSAGGRDFRTIVGSLVQLGYGVTWTVLDSQWFGVAQRRRRVFIVGHAGGRPRPEVLAVSEGLFGHPAPGRSQRQRATDEIAPYADPPEFVTVYGEHSHEAYAPNLPLLTAGGASCRGLEALVAHHDGSDVLPFVQNTRDEVRVFGDGDTVGALAAQPGMKQQAYLAGPVGVRRLTPVECERLQGFPDDWTGMLSDTQRYKTLGNTVTVNVAEWIGQQLATHGKQ